MSDSPAPSRSVHVAIVALAALWLALFVLGVVLARATEPTGDGFTRGLNRVGVLFQWKGLSFLAGLAAAVVTRSARERLGRGLRRLGYAPLAIDFALLALLVLLYGFAILQGC